MLAEEVWQGNSQKVEIIQTYTNGGKERDRESTNKESRKQSSKQWVKTVHMPNIAEYILNTSILGQIQNPFSRDMNRKIPCDSSTYHLKCHVLPR